MTESIPHSRIRRHIREGILIGWMALALFLLFAFSSYDAGDKAWSATGYNENTQNMAGVLGAYIADILLSTIGYIAFLLPLLSFTRAWSIFKSIGQSSSKAMGAERWDILLRITGVLLIVLSGTAVAEYNWKPLTWFGWEMPMGSGGIIGQAMAKSTLAMLGTYGTNLLLAVMFLLGLAMFMDISWLWVCEWLGDKSIALGKWILRYYQSWREQQQQRAAQPKLEPILKPQKPKKLIPMPSTTKPKPVKRNVKAPDSTTLADKELVLETPLPQLELLDSRPSNPSEYSSQAIESLSKRLKDSLADFGISAEVVSVMVGPVVTRFEIQPAAGIKASKVSGISQDIARSLAVPSVRVVEVIPGKSVIGIEIPNAQRQIVNLRQVLASNEFEEASSPLTLALGYDIAGTPIVYDLGKMPHALVAGTTGSGKSVAINVMLMSILYKATPDEIKLILIDPKMLELSVYEGIPHLLTPVITDMKNAANGLRWCVVEMDRRYKLMSELGVRNLAGYNRKIKEAAAQGDCIIDPLKQPVGSEIIYRKIEDISDHSSVLQPLFSIVVVIDEFADMIMIVGKKVEQLIARIAQKARAAGIHLLLATQRPSVDVITGLIKANIPTRVAFQVSSRIDSRTILDQGGAEQLLGHGDMLFLPSGTSVPIRVHGAFVDDHEVHKVVKDWRQRGRPQYLDEITEGSRSESISAQTEREGSLYSDDPEADSMYDEAVEFVCESRKASISSLQRKLRIGYNRAARLIEAMEAAGLVSPMEANGNRSVLTPDQRGLE